MIKRNLLKFGVVVMASACMVGCGSKNEESKPVNTTTPTEVVTEVETTTPEVETTTPVEEVTTETPTEAPTIPQYPVAEGCTYYVAATGKTLKAGEGMPSTPQFGDKYETTDYIYVYDNKISDDGEGYIARTEGWNVSVKDNQKTTYEEILSSIAGKNITALYSTFAGCSNLTTAPEIPSSVVELNETFWGCKNLTTAPEIPLGVSEMIKTFNKCINLTTAPKIPPSVTNMYGTFKHCSLLTTVEEIPSSVTDMNTTFFNCTSLTGTIIINANPADFLECFGNVDFDSQGLALTGSSTMLEELKLTNYDRDKVDA